MVLTTGTLVDFCRKGYAVALLFLDLRKGFNRLYRHRLRMWLGDNSIFFGTMTAHPKTVHRSMAAVDHQSFKEFCHHASMHSPPTTLSMQEKRVLKSYSTQLAIAMHFANLGKTFFRKHENSLKHPAQSCHSSPLWPTDTT